LNRPRLKATACHEAGHAVMAVILHVPFVLVSIEPKPWKWGVDEGGRIAFGKAPRWVIPQLNLRDVNYVERRILTGFAGGEAEYLLYGREPRVSVKNDRAGCRELGCTVLRLDPEFPTEVLGAYLHYMRLRARLIISQPLHWECVRAVADALVAHKTVSARRVRRICRETEDLKREEANRVQS
jgi:hypothetical protein